MDAWFTHEPMIRSILDEGLDVIGMVKQLKQRYLYKDGFYTLPELRKRLAEYSPGNQFGSILVKKMGSQLNWFLSEIVITKELG